MAESTQASVLVQKAGDLKLIGTMGDPPESQD